MVETTETSKAEAEAEAEATGAETGPEAEARAEAHPEPGPEAKEQAGQAEVPEETTEGTRMDPPTGTETDGTPGTTGLRICPVQDPTGLWVCC